MEVSIDFEQVFANRIAYTGNTGFTARSNINDGTFLRDSWRLSAVNYLCKKASS